MYKRRTHFRALNELFGSVYSRLSERQFHAYIEMNDKNKQKRKRKKPRSEHLLMF